MILNVSFQLMPKIPVIDLNKITLEKSNLQISDNDINNSLSDIAKKHERFVPLKSKENVKMETLFYLITLEKLTKKNLKGVLEKMKPLFLDQINLFLDMRSKWLD